MTNKKGDNKGDKANTMINKKGDKTSIETGKRKEGRQGGHNDQQEGNRREIRGTPNKKGDKRKQKTDTLTNKKGDKCCVLSPVLFLCLLVNHCVRFISLLFPFVSGQEGRQDRRQREAEGRPGGHNDQEEGGHNDP